MKTRLLITAATAVLLSSPAFAQATTDSGSAPAATASGVDSGTAPAATTSAADSGTAPAATTSGAASASAGDQAAQAQHTIPANSGTDAATQTMSAGSADVGKSTSTPSTPADQNGHVGGAPAETAHVSTESELTYHDWPFDGVFGIYNRTAVQRGFQVYKQVCSACHSLNLLSYRNLEDIGYSEGQVKAIAAGVQINDINDSGEDIQRPGRPSDHFHAPFANKKAAQAANNGAAPPDMSLLVKAREGGADYIYSILTGYTDPPKGVTLLPGQYYNKAMAGHIIAMPPPLTTDGQVSYDGFTGVTSTRDQNAQDVAQFLAWASEPHMEERKRVGVIAVIFLLIMAGVSYAYKRRLWKDVH